MDALGYHILLELYGCDASVLNDTARVKEILTKAALLAGARIVGSAFHHFNPHGVSGVVIIAESHFSVHTWPEHEYAAIDIFTCGEDLKPDVACEYMTAQLKAKNSTMVEMKRGMIPAENGRVKREIRKEKVLACKR